MTIIINKSLPNITNQKGSALAWILVVIFIITSGVGWLLYLQTDIAFKKNKKQKQHLQQRYSQKSDELNEYWNKLQSLQDKKYQLTNEITSYQTTTKKLESEVALGLQERKKLNDLLNQQKQNADLLLSCTNNNTKLKSELLEKQKNLDLQAKNLTTLAKQKETQLNNLLTQCQSTLVSENEKTLHCKNEITVLAQQLAESKKQLSISINKHLITTSKVDEAKKTVEGLTQQLAIVTSDIEELRIEFEHSQQLLKKYQSKYQNKTQLLQNWELITTNLDQQLNQMREEQTDLQVQLEQAKQQYQLCQQQLLIKVTSQQDVLVTALQQPVEEFSSVEKADSIEEKINSYINKNDILTIKNLQLMDKNKQLEKQLAKTRTTNIEQAPEPQANKQEAEAIALLQNKLKAEINKKKISITRQYDKSTQIKVGNALMFVSGQIQISQQGTHILDNIAQLLLKFPQRKIEIIGHTDNLPVRSGTHTSIVSNWELSAARAAATIRYLQHASKIPPQRMLLVGASQYQPLAKGSTKVSRAQNRRIEIRLLAEDKKLK
ncbi:MAG: OmpA family protein [Pseudomonadota bacterium]